VTGPTKGRVRLEKVQVGIPEGLYRQIEEVVRDGGEWMSVVDFLREAGKEKLDRWKKDHPLGPSHPRP
jgi:Arc/MetJ-type ribon-helix-helix transcriptional regulator